MTIGTPFWDEFVANLKEVKVTVEDMGFMPDNFPCESELKSMTAQQRVDIEHIPIENLITIATVFINDIINFAESSKLCPFALFASWANFCPI